MALDVFGTVGGDALELTIAGETSRWALAELREAHARAGALLPLAALPHRAMRREDGSAAVQHASPAGQPALRLVAVLVAADQAAGAAARLPRHAGAHRPQSADVGALRAGGGPVFVAEKRGVVKAFDSLADPTATTVIDLRTDTMNVSDRGLLGLAVDPGWPAGPTSTSSTQRDADIGGPSPKFGTPGADADTCLTPSTGCVVSGRLLQVRLDPATDQAVGRAGGSTAGASSSRATRSATCASVRTGCST